MSRGAARGYEGRTAALLALLTLWPAAAWGRPEITTNLGISIGRRARPPDTDLEGIFGLGLEGTLLVDRESSAGFAIGPTMGVWGFDFAELDLHVGGSLLIPLLEAFPLLLTAAPLLSADEHGLGYGGLARLAWTVHAFPRLGAYVLSAGVHLESRLYAELEGRDATLDWSIGIDLDAFALLWPAMFLWEALFGENPEE